MTIYIERGFTILTKYAESVGKDPQKVERVRKLWAQVKAALQEEGLDISDPSQAVHEAQEKVELEKHQRYQDHLAAITQEALRAEGGYFVHTSQALVIRAIKDSEDPRLIKTYSDAGIRSQMGRAVWDGLRVVGGELISSVLASNESRLKLPSRGWVEMLEYASTVLPEDTTTTDVSVMLAIYPDICRYADIGGRIQAARDWLKN